MSWIAELADKAENILNKLDQNAATALQISTNDMESQTPSIAATTALLQSVSNKQQVGDSSPLHVRYAAASKTIVDSDKYSVMAAIDNAVHLKPQSSSAQGSPKLRSDLVAIDILENTLVPLVEEKKAECVEQSIEANSGVNKKLNNSTEYNQELRAFKIGLAEVSKERDSLKLRLNAFNNDSELSSLRQHVVDIEACMQSLTSENIETKYELSESKSSCAKYMQSISKLELNLTTLKQEYIDVTKKLQLQIKETEEHRQQLEGYRTKAQRALQMKDNQIAELKAGLIANAAAVGSCGENNEVSFLQMELETLRKICKSAREENATLLHQLEQAEKELKASNEMLASINLTEAELRQTIRIERERYMQLESENRILTQELCTLRQQLSNHLAASATCLHERDQLIQKLKVQVKARGVDADLADSNMRIKSLTQSLVDKQNHLEAVTADRNALRIQMEQLQNKIQEKSYNTNDSKNSPHRNALFSNSTDDVKAQFPALMKETPFDNRVSRRVKRAYSSLDSAGIRLGAFLRRYPLLRICAIMYVGFLHIWVIFVLLSSTPT